MDIKNACELLKVEESASLEMIDQAFNQKIDSVNKRLAKAPTDALKKKYNKLLEEIKQAYETLKALKNEEKSPTSLSATQAADIPSANPFYTAHTKNENSEQAGFLELNPNQIVAERYTIKRKIGVGGMGVVYAAYDENRDEDIAVKILLPHLVASESARKRFLQEARISSKLSHPNILNVFDVQKEQDTYFLTMELLEGQTLRNMIDSYKSENEHIEVDKAIKIIKQICEALEYAHKHTIHRDIKPENIFICADKSIKLMDFGIARLMSASQLTVAGTSLGTAYYMAPEQLTGQFDVDERSDQYSVAVVLYEMLTGFIPTGVIKSPDKKRKDVSKALSNAIMKALDSEPEERFDDIQSFFKAINVSTEVDNKEVDQGCDIKKTMEITTHKQAEKNEDKPVKKEPVNEDNLKSEQLNQKTADIQADSIIKDSEPEKVHNSQSKPKRNKFYVFLTVCFCISAVLGMLIYRSHKSDSDSKKISLEILRQNQFQIRIAIPWMSRLDSAHALVHDKLLDNDFEEIESIFFDQAAESHKREIFLSKVDFSDSELEILGMKESGMIEFYTTPNKYFVDDEILFDGNDLEDVRVIKMEFDNTKAIQFVFKPEAVSDISMLTGYNLAIFVNDKLIVAPGIMEKISDGTIMLSDSDDKIIRRIIEATKK